jgi:hypothetical protein
MIVHKIIILLKIKVNVLEIVFKNVDNAIMLILIVLLA